MSGILDRGRLICTRSDGGAEGAVRSRRRSRRRSSPPPAATFEDEKDEDDGESGACSHESAPPQHSARVHRPLRDGRAQLVPHQAVRLVGDRVLLLDGSRTRSRSCSSRTASSRTGGSDRHRPADHDPPDRRGRSGPTSGSSSSCMTETVAWERWEGTIEYTFMAPLTACDAPARHGHLRRRCYGIVRASVVFVAIAAVLRARTCRTRTSSPRSCCSPSHRSRSSASG